MFYTKKEDSSSYEEILVEERKFYRKKVKPTVRKKRYSDQFKDPLFIEKDIHRKLKMIKKFQTSIGDIQSETKKYLECIEKCIYILKQELEVPITVMFDSFDLKKYGFSLQDFGIEEDSGIESD